MAFDTNGNPVYVPGEANPQTGRPWASKQEFDLYWSQNSPGTTPNSTRPEIVTSPGGAKYTTKGDDWSNWDWSKTRNSQTNFTQGGYLPNTAGINVEGTWGLPNGDITFQTGTYGPDDPNLFNAPTFAAIDPHTGQITFLGSSSYGGGFRTVGTTNYDPNHDYGLGPSNLGIIPIEHDAHGTPTKFYAPTPAGGGQAWDTLEQAQAAIGSFKKLNTDISNAKNPPKVPQAPPPPGKPGILTQPLQGENFFDDTKGYYTQPTRQQQLYDSTKDFFTKPTETSGFYDANKGFLSQPSNAQLAWNQFLSDPTQPTASEQYWNKWSGIFNDPNYLQGVYDRGQQAAQTTLDRKSSSAGWGDSGAAARATGNLGIQFTDAARKGMQDWATTGAGLASAADVARNAALNTRLGVVNTATGVDAGNTSRFNAGLGAAMGADSSTVNRLNTGLNAAGGADSSWLAQLLAGQGAATGAENLTINRETGGLNSATQLGQAESALSYTGLSTGDQQKLESQIATLSLQVQQGTLTADQAYQDAQGILQGLGVAGKAAANWYVASKLSDAASKKGGKTNTGSNFWWPSSGN